MRFFKSPLAAALLCAVASGAIAQTAPGTYVTPTTGRADVAQGLFGQANGATSCNTVSQTAAQDTVTINAPSGNFVIVQGIYIENSTNATGVTQTGTISMTGISSNGGLPAFINYGTALSTTMPTQIQDLTFPSGLKGAATVTFVPSATQSANNYLCIQVAAGFSPF